MKFIRLKTIKGKEYYYFEYPLKIHGSRRRIFSRYLGLNLPANLGEIIQNIFREIAPVVEKKISTKNKNYFYPKSIVPIEDARLWYQSLHHELHENDLRLFRALFGILFILNSNRAEGSKVTRKDIEKFIKRKQKPKTQLDLEIINSLAALRFAFSKNMKWNIESLKIMHALLFDKISPYTAGKFKKGNVIVGNEFTTDWKNIRQELRSLYQWLIANKKKYYPPILALEFHYRFEAIHPFEDGNGRIGRLLFNAFLLQQRYMPVIFFSENHAAYNTAISYARKGRKKKLAHYFIKQLIKTKKAILRYKNEGVIKGGSPAVGRWEIEHGTIRRY